MTTRQLTIRVLKCFRFNSDDAASNAVRWLKMILYIFGTHVHLRFAIIIILYLLEKYVVIAQKHNASLLICAAKGRNNPLISIEL